MANKEWLERKETLLMVAVIMSGWNFDDNGLVKDPQGRMERCDLATIYFALHQDSGEGEQLWNGETLYTVFEPTKFERAVLSLTELFDHPIFYVVVVDNNGFVLGKEYTKDQLDELRARCHTDNPDDEIVNQDVTRSGD